MANTPEAKAKIKIIKAVKDACNRIGAELYYETHAGESYSSPTLDITGTIGLPEYQWGIPFAIEVKRFDGKGKLRERQARTLREMRQAHIAAVVIDSDETLQLFVDWILLRCRSQLYIAET
jgi:hypothetical protein